jgi:SagB-type dehydrogenase family enzyme
MTTVPVEELLSLRPGVYTAIRDGVQCLLTNRGGQTAGPATDQLRAVLARLAAGPVDEVLARWRAGGWLRMTIRYGGRRLYTLQPYRRPPPAPPPPDGWELSRYTMVRRDRTCLTGAVVESPRAWCELHVHDPAVLAGLFGGVLPDPVTSRLTRDLWWAGMAAPAGAEDRALATRQWYPHELWFHHRSRINDRMSLEEGFGGTYWLKDEFDWPPPPPAPRGPTVELHRPDLDRLRTTDPPFTAVVEDRRSVREFNDDAPLTVAQLGELLFRAARRSGSPVAYGTPQERRPYPAGGGVHDLVLYPVVRRVTGLEPGMYRYDPEQHVLARVCEPNGATRRLLGAAGAAAVLPRKPGQARQPQLLLVIAARFERTLWKYQQIGYSMLLKNVGVLLHQLYLVATAMGLGPCALAVGDAAAFAEATGSDPMTESSVGEFLLGSPLPGEVAPEG